jgi:hypothetical protein
MTVTTTFPSWTSFKSSLQSSNANAAFAQFSESKDASVLCVPTGKTADKNSNGVLGFLKTWVAQNEWVSFKDEVSLLVALLLHVIRLSFYRAC